MIESMVVVTILRGRIPGFLKISLPLTVVFGRFLFFGPSDFARYAGMNAIQPRRAVIALRAPDPRPAFGFRSLRSASLEILRRPLEGFLSPLHLTRLRLASTL